MKTILTKKVLENLKLSNWQELLNGLEEDKAKKLTILYNQIEGVLEKHYSENGDDKELVWVYILPILRRIVNNTQIDFKIDVADLAVLIFNTQYFPPYLENIVENVDCEGFYCQMIENFFTQNNLKIKEYLKTTENE